VAFEHASKVIEALVRLDCEQQRALLYFDESGFSPNPPLQYGWGRIRIPPFRPRGGCAICAGVTERCADDRVQALHIKVIHILIELVERAVQPSNYPSKR
jgi:hypothetical protein